MSKKPTLMLIDGLAVFYRAYHAIAHLTNAEGMPTGAIYGFAQMLLKAHSDIKPDYAVLAWDKARTAEDQRMKLYPAYKAKRAKMADDFYAQIPYIRELADAMGMPMLELDGYEADDIIGTIIRRHPELRIIVVSNDRDTFQLLDGHVEIYMQRRGMTETELMDAAGVREKYGIEPHQIIDWKALAGDASDNIPGVAGVGDKTAVSLLQKYGTLEKVYEHLDEIPGKLQDRLRADRENAFLSQKLATIMCDAPIDLDMESARTGRYDRQKLHELFRALGFKSLLAKLPAELQATASETPSLFDEPVAKKDRHHIKAAKYRSVTTEKELKDLAAKLSKQPAFAIDTETDGLDANGNGVNLVGLSISYQEGEAYYVPVGHTEGTQLSCDEAIAILKPVLESPTIAKVGHNLKFDYQVLKRYGVTLSPVSFDTMIASFILNPLGRSQSLGDLAFREFGIEMIPISDLIGSGKNQSSFDKALIEEATTYACEDADVAWRLYQLMEPQIREKGFERLATETEWPLIPVLAEMELAGIELDVSFLRQLGEQQDKQLALLQEQIWLFAGEQFNISSPGQLSVILFDKLGLSRTNIKKGKTGYSTAADQLEKLQDAHPIVPLIGQYRELDKLKTTYIDALPALVKKDGRVHTSFSQTIAQTGRLSSANPNLQNIPVRTEVGREIRKAFVAPKGRVLVSADYSQIELRVAAALSGDEAMIRTFKEGVDLHQQTAAELFSVALDEVTKEQRYASKTINFGVLYGMSAHGLAVATKMGRDEAAQFINRYFEVRPKLAAYIEDTKKFARQHEYTATLFGRKRPCPEINSNNFMLASAAERMAVNVPIQGTAADIYKLAMIALDKELDDRSQLLLQIHDELIVETDEKLGNEVAALMKRVMEGVYDLGVPLAVDTAVGANWGEL